MSVAEVQSRTQEIDARLRALFGRPPAALSSSSAAAVAATGAGSGSFSTTLQDAQAVTPAGLQVAPTSALPVSSGPDVGAQVVDVAERYLGTPYKWGGAAPGGFDCSGLVQWSYKQLGVTLPRVAADQAKQGTAVPAAQARPGDLVFFGRPVDHVGIYAGGGKMVVAPHTGDVVKVESVDLSTAVAIRRVVPAPASSPVPPAGAADLSGLPAAGRPYAAAITSAARDAGISPALLGAVAWSESAFNPAARSPAGAVGLMQLMPGTAASLGVDPRDPAQALKGGATYLAQQLKAFGGRADLAIAAYNAGPGAVSRYGGVPPYQETQAYVATVLSHYRALGGAA